MNAERRPKAPPAFQFYPNDFVSGTRKMTTAEVGGYILLLCAQWDDGYVPGDDLIALAQTMRCTRSVAKSIWTRISDKFVRDESGQWKNERLERVRREQSDYKAKKAESGAKGAAARWRADSTARVLPIANVKQTDGSPVSDLQSPNDESKNDSSKERPPRDLMAYHEKCFVECYHRKPAAYGAKEAAQAKRLIQQYGFDRACELVQAYFSSADPWIRQTGHSFGPLSSNTTQNKLIAEMSGRAPKGDHLDGLREFARG